MVYSKESSGTFPEGTLAHLRCHDGYAVSNPTQQARCEKNGQWTTETLGKCEQLCTNLPDIPNGKVIV